MSKYCQSFYAVKKPWLAIKEVVDNLSVWFKKCGIGAYLIVNVIGINHHVGVGGECIFPIFS